MEQRFTFDQVAAAYTAARPDYPEALIDDVVSFAGLSPSDAVLEIGCGPGQATKSFAARGFRILAIDPGTELIRAARNSLAKFANVELLETTFEAWPATAAAFRLVAAAQSWHWVSRDMRLAKAAEVLMPGGALAVFGNVPVGLPASLLGDFKEIYLRRTGVWGPPPEARYLPGGLIGAELADTGVFGPATHKAYPWKRRYTTSSYCAFLTTRSDHRMLAPAVCEALLDEIARSIDTHGGAFEMDYETHLYMCRRVNRA